MKNGLFSQMIVLGIVILFFGTCTVQSVTDNDETIRDVFDEIGNLNLDTEIFNSTDDVTIDMHSPNNNQGSDVDLKLSNRYGTTSDWERDVLCKFDISSIPSGTQINSAILKIFYYQYLDTNPTGRDLTLYRITSNWNEDSVTWNTRPNLAAEITDSYIVPSSPGIWMEWDVTVDVQDFIDEVQENYGWQIMDEEYWGGSNIPTCKFHSKEYGNYIPYLEIHINEAPNKPDIVGPASGAAGESYDYNFVAFDPEDEEIYYYIDWGDDTNTGWIGPYDSGEQIIYSYTWTEQGTYEIKCKAKDIFDAESDWGTLEVSMPVNQPVQFPIMSWLLERFPNMFPMLRHLTS